MYFEEIDTLLRNKISPEEFKIDNEFYGLQYRVKNSDSIIKKIMLTTDLNLEAIHELPLPSGKIVAKKSQYIGAQDNSAAYGRMSRLANLCLKGSAGASSSRHHPYECSDNSCIYIVPMFKQSRAAFYSQRIAFLNGNYDYFQLIPTDSASLKRLFSKTLTKQFIT